MIRIQGVRWRYHGTDAAVLDGLDLHIRRGEVVLLCGPSGSGKSTALRLMNGLIPHFHRGSLDGSVSLDGHSITELPLDGIGRLTGTVLQHPRRQFFTATVDTELAFAMENFGEPPLRIQNRVNSTMDTFGLASWSDRRLAELSGGQQQQVVCAAAVTHRPQLLLLDEPTSNLATDAIARFAAVISRLRRMGVTIVIAEHRLHAIAHLVDRIVVLRNGHVATEWSASEFAELSESQLAAEGLRNPIAVPRNGVPRTYAYGPSVDSAGVDMAESTVTDAALTLRRIRCSFRGKRVLHIDEARFPAGTVTAITGPNGAGKSTLARILVGLQRHDGDVFFTGRRLDRARRQRSSAMVMQDVQRQLFTDSVERELQLGVVADAQTCAASLLAELGLEHLRERHPLALSGGQQQRLVVATARLSERRIVVFDEPSSGVDCHYLASITKVMRDLAAEGVVVVVISHDDELLDLVAGQELRLKAVEDA